MPRILFLLFTLTLLARCADTPPGNALSIRWSRPVDSLLHDTIPVRRVVDSLKKEVLRAPNDTAAINLLNDLAERCAGDATLLLAEEAMSQSKKLNYRYGMADAAGRKGFYYFMRDRFDSAIFYCGKCLGDARSAGFTTLQVQALTVMGNVRCYQFDSLGADTTIRMAIALAKTIGEKKRLGMCYNMLGETYMFYGQPETARRFLDSATVAAEASGEKTIDSYALLVMGSIAIQEGDYTLAMEKFTHSLAVAVEAEDDIRMAAAYGSIAEVYWTQKILDKAMDNLDRSIACAERARDTTFLAYDIGMKGQIFYEQKQYDRSLAVLDSAISLAGRKGSPYIVAEGLATKGAIYRETGRPAEAKPFLFEALALARKINHPSLIAGTLGSLGETCMALGQEDSAFTYAQQGLALGTPMNAQREMMSAAGTLWKIYRNRGDFRNALDMHLRYSVLKDSVSSDEQLKKFAALEYKARENELKAIQAKKEAALEADKLRREEELRRQRIVNYATAAGGGLVLVLLIVSVRAFRNKQKANTIISAQKDEVERQKLLVEEKNQAIVDSITYAKRLQDAILPPLRLVRRHLPDSFILYLPKDIVAGDFYWFERVLSPGNLVLGKAQNQELSPQNRPEPSSQNPELLLFAVADCTGHGVPGAMVSVVCSNALNRTVNEFGITEPGKILDRVRELVLETFKKSESEVMDGMDISLACLDLGARELKWAGAHNPLWIVTNGELRETKADKQPVGKQDNAVPFTTHTLQLSAGDVIYLFSDGYADQFGGPKGKKFRYKQLQELLLQIAPLPMDEQKKRLGAAFTGWRGDLEQIDDVCVMGVRV